MKAILSAAALLVAAAFPAFAEEAAGTQTQPAPTVVEIVPAATEPATSEAQPAAVDGETQSKAAMGGHGCGSKNTVYLTN